MNLTPMKFKNYTWPHNPRVYTIRYTRTLTSQKVPFGTYALQDLGLACRVMEGEGEFCGKGAYEEFKKLATVFYSAGAGTLVHPNWTPTAAHFVALKLMQEPRRDYVRYSFAFWEDVGEKAPTLKEVTPPKPVPGGTAGAVKPAAPASGSAVYHTVTKGENLWRIAQDAGVSLARILELNGDVKNPNLILVGQKVRIG